MAFSSNPLSQYIDQLKNVYLFEDQELIEKHVPS